MVKQFWKFSSDEMQKQPSRGVLKICNLLKFAAYFQSTFFYKHLWTAASGTGKFDCYLQPCKKIANNSFEIEKRKFLFL